MKYKICEARDIKTASAICDHLRIANLFVNDITYKNKTVWFEWNDKEKPELILKDIELRVKSFLAGLDYANSEWIEYIKEKILEKTDELL